MEEVPKYGEREKIERKRERERERERERGGSLWVNVQTEQNQTEKTEEQVD